MTRDERDELRTRIDLARRARLRHEPRASARPGAGKPKLMRVEDLREGERPEGLSNGQRRRLLGELMIRWSRTIEEHRLDFDVWLAHQARKAA